VRVEREQAGVGRAQRDRELGRGAGVAARDPHAAVRADEEEQHRPLGPQAGHVPVLALGLGPGVDVAGVEQDPPAVAVARPPPQAVRLGAIRRAARVAAIGVHAGVVGRFAPILSGPKWLRRPRSSR